MLSNDAAKDEVMQRISFGFAIIRRSPENQILQGQDLNRHQKSKENADSYFGHRVGPNLLIKKLPDSNIDKTSLYNKGDTAAVCRKYRTGRKKSDTPRRSNGTKNSRNLLLINVQSGY